MKRCSAIPFRQRGISLVEIMIGLMLSAVLSAGVVQIYLSNKETYYLQDELSRLQENGRYAIMVLQRTLRGAGNGAGRMFVPENTRIASDLTAYNPANSRINLSRNDRFEIIREGWTDCTGNQIANPAADTAPVQITEFFYIEQDPNDNRKKNLACFSGGGVAQLVENVETMEVLYGVDENGDRSADAYRNAADISGTFAWPRVVSVRIALLLASSPEESRSRIVPQPMAFPTLAVHPLLAAFETSNGIPLLFDSDGDRIPDTNIAPNIDDAGLPDPDGKPDRRLYRAFTTTIALRKRVL